MSEDDEMIYDEMGIVLGGEEEAMRLAGKKRARRKRAKREEVEDVVEVSGLSPKTVFTALTFITIVTAIVDPSLLIYTLPLTAFILFILSVKRRRVKKRPRRVGLRWRRSTY